MDAESTVNDASIGAENSEIFGVHRLSRMARRRVA